MLRLKPVLKCMLVQAVVQMARHTKGEVPTVGFTSQGQNMAKATEEITGPVRI
jgi:hypothetical protein